MDGRLARLAAWLEWALLVAGLGVITFLAPHGLWGDGQLRFVQLEALLGRGAPSADPTPYSMIGPLLATPFYELGRLIQTPHWWIRHFNLIAFFLGLLALGLLARRDLPGAICRRFLLLLVAASMFAHHTVMSFYMELTSALLVGCGLYLDAKGRPLLGAALAALGAANTPGLLLPLALVCAVRARETRALRSLVPVTAAVLLFVLENLVRYGTLLNQYASIDPPAGLLPTSGHGGFSYPLLFGLIGTLLSAGKGLLFFVPALFLPLGARQEVLGQAAVGAYRRWIVFCVGLVLTYSKWWAWSGDWFWGPRFHLLACLPAALVLAARLTRPEVDGLGGRVLTLLALVLSCWVAANGAFYGTQNGVMGLCMGPNSFQAVCQFVPEFSVLWRPFMVDEGMDTRLALGLAYFAGVALALGAPLAWRILAESVSRLRVALPRYAPSAWRW